MADGTVERVRARYNLPYWSEGYFDVDARGRVVVRPDRDPGRPGLCLAELADEAAAQGLATPLLIRFLDILRDRVDALCDAFDAARAGAGYRGAYRAVYPVKVNQQRRVVEELVGHGGERVGLEAGSKPELLAVLAAAPPGGVVVCNGYKDREYVRLALRGRQLGLETYLVVEKLSEVALIAAEAERLGVEPLLGLRVRLASMGTGNWQNTGGERSKFGLSAGQALAAAERLQAAGLAGSLRMLHFHLGSQIPNVHDIQRGLREGARYYAALRALGLPVAVVDVGGGLGIDYEGTRSRAYCSINYTLEEYAHNVVQALAEVCEGEGLPHPAIVTEAGRAMTAHHAVLVTDVVDAERPVDGADPEPPGADEPNPLRRLWEAFAGVGRRTAGEVYHDASHWLAEAQSLYVHGLLSLPQRARAERYYFAAARALLAHLDPRRRHHRALLDELHEDLAEKLFGNFSVFQSLPDVWAIDQIFPILPLTGLDRPAESHATLHDLTCDSDGRIHRYVSDAGIEPTLALPPREAGDGYRLGLFLVGAYQEILGDRHNLFGDTHSVNVELTATGHRLSDARRGEAVADVLAAVAFEPDWLRARYRERVGAAGLDGEQAGRCLAELEAGLGGYTYLERSEEGDE